MCGLVGVAGLLTAKDDAIIRKLLVLDYFRGPDSTGLASVQANGEIRIAKLAADPFTLFDSGKFKNAQSGVLRLYMGHNRASTRGATNNFNAHPYQFDHIIGAHNGTLDLTSWSRLETELGEKFPVDSQALIAAIAKFGIKKAIELCTSGKDPNNGAWSLTWYDTVDGSINFLRNKHRPMWYAYAKDFKRLFWASEWWMLEAVGRSEGIEFYAEGEKGYRFFPTDEDKHYRFDVSLIVSADSKPKPKVKEAKGREPVAVVSHGAFPTREHGGGHGNVCGVSLGGREIHTRELTENSTTNSTTSHGSTILRSRPTNHLNWFGTPDHPYAGYINKENFAKHAKYGCTWCSKDVQFGDAGITIIEREQMVLCSKCSGHDAITDETPNRIYVENQAFNALR